MLLKRGYALSDETTQRKGAEYEEDDDEDGDEP
jgi:hypothetical protein